MRNCRTRSCNPFNPGSRGERFHKNLAASPNTGCEMGCHAGFNAGPAPSLLGSIVTTNKLCSGKSIQAFKYQFLGSTITSNILTPNLGSRLPFLPLARAPPRLLIATPSLPQGRVHKSFRDVYCANTRYINESVRVKLTIWLTTGNKIIMTIYSPTITQFPNL